MFRWEFQSTVRTLLISAIKQARALSACHPRGARGKSAQPVEQTEVWELEIRMGSGLVAAVLSAFKHLTRVSMAKLLKGRFFFSSARDGFASLAC